MLLKLYAYALTYLFLYFLSVKNLKLDQLYAKFCFEQFRLLGYEYRTIAGRRLWYLVFCKVYYTP